ncbi:hypothetical protein IW262DRAFT_474629 [Armillaria fumosa]|nr:hypothetical protein IW262DRAFT_474629 [Armillaria fumosa]
MDMTPEKVSASAGSNLSSMHALCYSVFMPNTPISKPRLALKTGEADRQFSHPRSFLSLFCHASNPDTGSSLPLYALGSLPSRSSPSESDRKLPTHSAALLRLSIRALWPRIFQPKSSPDGTSTHDGDIDWDDRVYFTVALPTKDGVAIDEREPPRGRVRRLSVLFLELALAITRRLHITRLG